MNPSPKPSSPRIAALDAARALGVAAMVFGHTLDAVLSPAVRGSPGVAAYWQLRGLTAPLFLVVSGWAITAASLRSGAAGGAILGARAPRLLLLVALGLALRFPAWDTAGFLDGNRAAWRHFLAFDALHCVALGGLLASAVLAARANLGDRLTALAALSTLLLAAGPLLPEITATGIPEIAFEQILRGTSPFPALPWAAYVLAGAAVGLVAPLARGRVALAAGLGLSGAALVAAAHLAGLDDLAIWSPVLFALRLGQVLLLVAALGAVPAALAARAAPLGRASLFVYVAHVPVVYGWGVWQGLAQRVGPTLGLGAAAALATSLLAAALATRVLAGSAAGPLRALAARAVPALRGQLTHQ